MGEVNVLYSLDVVADHDEATELTDLNSHGRVGDHFGWVETSAGASRYVADRVPGPWFDRILAIAWSGDASRFCYAGVRGGGVSVLADHEPGPQIANLSKQIPPGFSPDARTLLYAGGDGRSFRLHLNHQPESDEVAPIRPAFGADGARLGWVAQKRGLLSSRQWAVIDGIAGPQTKGLAADIGIQFSPGGRHSVYAARQDKGFSLIRDGVVGESYEAIGHLTFSPDGERYAAVVRVGSRQLLTLDGDRPEHDASTRPLFSPDGRKVAWAAERGNQYAMMVDGNTMGLAADLHDSYAWSPDGGRLAYLEATGQGWRLAPDGSVFDAISGLLRRLGSSEYATYRHRGPIFKGQRAGRWALVVDDETGPWFEAIDSLTLTDDGEHMAYAAASGNGHTIVLDGRSVGLCAETEKNSLVISPDGQHVAYVSVDEGGRHLALDDTASPEAYEGVAPLPFFSAEGLAHGWAVRGSTVFRLSASPS